MRHLKSLPLGCLLGLMGIPAAAAVMGGQQRLNWAADDARRVAALETDGTRLGGST